MKKLVLIMTGLVAACGWADRTANRDWVTRNFAPTGLVARVEALEAGGGGETDPVFGAWRAGDTVPLGSGRFQFNHAEKKVTFDGGATWLVFPKAEIGPEETTGSDTLVSAGGLAGRLDAAQIRLGQSAVARYPGAVGVGFSAKANEEGSVALGSFSVANAENAVQIGEGTNASAGTLQFRGWTLVGADGKIPSGRITPSAVLAALQELDAAQLAALKGLLGL